MAKINLLTIHWGNSYGGTLQTYATVKILQELGHKVNVINLKHPKTKLSNLYKKGFSRSRLFQDVKFLLFKRITIGHFTRTAYSIEECNVPNCDVTIVGSDQVWNKDITYPIDKAYFLDFAIGSDKLSFASSFGKFEWNGDDEERRFILKCFSDFKAISVREQSGVEICNNIFGVKATQVLDPTLCYSHYDKLIGRKKPYHEIFPFLLRTTTEANTICKIVSQKTNLPVYKPGRWKRLFGIGPKGWLSRMKHSDYIITDSFHGLAFSLIFNKEFIVLCADEKKFARLRSLLRLVNLEERYVASVSDMKARINMINTPIDYSTVNLIIERERTKTITFLTDNIQ